MVSMGRVHTRLHLEHEAREWRVDRARDSGDIGAGLRGRSVADEGFEKLMNTEVGDRGTE